LPNLSYACQFSRNPNVGTPDAQVLEALEEGNRQTARVRFSSLTRETTVAPDKAGTLCNPASDRAGRIIARWRHDKSIINNDLRPFFAHQTPQFPE